MGVWVSRGSSLTCTWPEDSTVSMMNLSLKPFIIASMAMNIMTLMVTPAMHTSDCRLCDMKYRMATIHRIRSPAFVVVQVFNLHVQTESLHYNLVKRLEC